MMAYTQPEIAVAKSNDSSKVGYLFGYFLSVLSILQEIQLIFCDRKFPDTADGLLLLDTFCQNFHLSIVSQLLGEYIRRFSVEI